jgi:hypothetical protein
MHKTIVSVPAERETRVECLKRCADFSGNPYQRIACMVRCPRSHDFEDTMEFTLDTTATESKKIFTSTADQYFVVFNLTRKLGIADIFAASLRMFFNTHI